MARSLFRKALGSLGFLVSTALLVGCAQPNQSAITGIQPDGEIIGGVEATGVEDYSKTIVSLYNVVRGELCTASIYSDSILITAAHCVYGPATDLAVIFGVDLDSEEVIVRRVESYVVSPFWNTRQNELLNTGDIAVVKFKGGLAPGFRPAELLTDLRSLRNGQVTTLAGYGISDGVNGTGSGRLRSVQTTIRNVTYTKTEILIDQTKGKGACHGDSGGPAYVKIGSKQLLYGVTSRGVNDRNDDCSVTAAYTSIPYYHKWIMSTAQALMKTQATATDATKAVNSL